MQGQQRMQWVISLGGNRGRRPVYVRSASNRVEILCTAVKDAKCHNRSLANAANGLLDQLVGDGANLRVAVALLAT
jgi:hypothetical protein